MDQEKWRGSTKMADIPIWFCYPPFFPNGNIFRAMTLRYCSFPLLYIQSSHLSAGWPSRSQNFQTAALLQRRVRLLSASRCSSMKCGDSSARSARSRMMWNSQSRMRRGKSAISAGRHSCERGRKKMIKWLYSILNFAKKVGRKGFEISSSTYLI